MADSTKIGVSDDEDGENSGIDELDENPTRLELVSLSKWYQIRRVGFDDDDSTIRRRFDDDQASTSPIAPGRGLSRAPACAIFG